MQLETSTIMLILFIVLLIISIWKIYAFLPNKQLEDDDTTEDAQEELIHALLSTIKKSNANINVDELYVNMIENEDFDKEKFWRFNKNRLNKLLEIYYLKNPHLKTIEDIYNEIKAKP